MFSVKWISFLILHTVCTCVSGSVFLLDLNITERLRDSSSAEDVVKYDDYQYIQVPLDSCIYQSYETKDTEDWSYCDEDDKKSSGQSSQSEGNIFYLPRAA